MAEPDLDPERLKEANRSLTRELLSAYEELDLVHTLSTIFATSSNVDEMGERLVAEAVASLEASAGFLAFTGAGMEEFEPVLRDATEEEVQAFVSVAASRILAGKPTLLDRAEAEGFDARPLLTVPLKSRDGIFGALGLMRPPDGTPFTAGDEKALSVLATQAASVILQKRNLDLTYLTETQNRINEGLQALLEISRELTATLDVDRVLSAIVNLSSRVVAYDRASIALKEGNRWRLRAVSGVTNLDRSKPEFAELESLLGWVGERGEPVRVETTPDGELKPGAPEAGKKLGEHFKSSGMSSLFSLMLADEEGVLGVYAVERTSGLCPSERARELLSVLGNQATVALRNAQLYQQVPLIGFLAPVLQRRRKLGALPRAVRIRWVVAFLAVVGALTFVPMELRVSGSARLVPTRTFAVSSAVAGRVVGIEIAEGSEVEQDQVLARLDDRDFRLQRAEAEASARQAERRVRQLEAIANPSGAAVERTRLARFRAEVALADAALGETVLRAPEEGVVLTARVQELVGHRLEAGTVLCSLAALDPLAAELAVPEADLALVKLDDPAYFKLDAYPDRVFSGAVTAVRPSAEDREGHTVVVVRIRLPNPDGDLLPGMQGRGRIRAGDCSLATFLFRRPARWIRSWFWF